MLLKGLVFKFGIGRFLEKSSQNINLPHNLLNLIF